MIMCRPLYKLSLLDPASDIIIFRAGRGHRPTVHIFYIFSNISFQCCLSFGHNYRKYFNIDLIVWLVGSRLKRSMMNRSFCFCPSVRFKEFVTFDAPSLSLFLGLYIRIRNGQIVELDVYTVAQAENERGREKIKETLMDYLLPSLAEINTRSDGGSRAIEKGQLVCVCVLVRACK